MLDRVWGGMNGERPSGRPDGRRRASRAVRPLLVEGLEERVVMTASLAAIPAVSSFSGQGYQVTLDGSADTDAQTYTVTSSNPDVKATVATGKFLTFSVSHTGVTGNASDPTFSGTVTFQLFDDLVPTTASLFESFVANDYYPGKQITRIVNDFSGVSGSDDTVIQGGGPYPNGASGSGQPGTPYNAELVQQLGFTQSGTLAVANTGAADSNDTQFFFNTAAEDGTGGLGLDYGYTIVGQLVAGQNIANDLAEVATEDQTGGTEKSMPINPVDINGATISDTNPNGVVHIDTTGAVTGETSTVTVTATDPTTDTTAQQSFVVTVVNTNSTTDPGPVTAPPSGTPNAVNNIVFKPLASPVSQDVLPGQATSVQLSSNDLNPSNKSVTQTYAITTEPAHGTISNFNATTGALTYTPDAGYTGTDTFTYTPTNTVASASGGTPTTYVGNTAKVTLTVASTPTPTATEVDQTVYSGVASHVQLVGNSETNNTSVVLSYSLATQPTHGTITSFNASNGTLLYTADAGYTGSDSFTYTTTNTGGTPSPIVSSPATVKLTVTAAPPTPVDTGAVRQVGTVLIVTPVPTTTKAKNTIVVNETDSSSAASNILVVTINGVYDTLQPLASGITRIIVYGGKASDDVIINPAVETDIPVTLDGGHGGVNVLQAGAGSTREHGWFGKNTLIGGTGQNELVGRAGHVTFKPTSTTTEIFAGDPMPGYRVHRHLQNNAYHLNAPGGQFYKDVNGKVVPIPTPKVGQSDTGTTTTKTKTTTTTASSAKSKK